MAVSYKFLKNHLQNLKYNVKKAYTFHSILISILFILILSIKDGGGGVGGGWRGRGFLLNGQTLLSVPKVICRQSLNHITINNGVHKILFDSWPLPREFSSPVFPFYVYVGPMLYVKH